MTATATPDLVFRAEDHTYTYRGVQLPSVTTLLKPIQPSYEFADPTMGTLVHELTAAADRGMAIVIPDAALGYIEAWRIFRQRCEPEFELIEKAVAHGVLGFAGTLDRAGQMWAHGIDGDSRLNVLLDIKTGDPDPWHGVQLAGYAIAVRAETWHRFGVYLSADGTYRLRSYRDRQDFTVFRALLNVHNWRAANGC